MLVVHKLACRADQHLDLVLTHRQVSVHVKGIIHAHQMPKTFIGFGKHQAFDLARAVFQRKKRHALIVSRGFDCDRGDHARNAHARTVGQQSTRFVRECADILSAQIGNALIVTVKQMSREIHTRRILFQHQLFALGVFGNRGIGERGLSLDLGHHAEHIQLPCHVVAVFLRHGINDLLIRGQQSGAIRAERIKRTGFDECLDHALVHILSRHALHEILKGGKIVSFALTAQRLDKLTAHVFERKQTEANGIAAAVKIGTAAVDIGRQHANAALIALPDVLRDLDLIAKHAGQKCRKILTRIMRL